MVRLHIVVPGIGGQYYFQKKSVFLQNWRSICSSFPPWIDEVKLTLRLYTTTVQKDFLGTSFRRSIEDEMAKNKTIFTLELLVQEGHLGTFFFHYFKNSDSPVAHCSYDYYLILLDDVLFTENFCLDRFMRQFIHHNLDALTASLDPRGAFRHHIMLPFPLSDSWKHPRIGLARRTNFVELFCTLFHRNAFERLLSTIHSKTIYVWGIDLLFYDHLRMRLGISDSFSVLHLSNEGQSQEKTHEELEDIKKKYNHNNFEFTILEMLIYREEDTTTGRLTEKNR